jgi:chemosensory pili system protein ChpA (sensor histidine kinase/response regulator)
VQSLTFWLAVVVVVFAAGARRVQRAKKKAEAQRAAREAIAAATLAAATSEVQKQAEAQRAEAEAEAQRVEAERKAANKAKRDAARAAATRVIEAEAERVRGMRATRIAEAERSAREAARRAVLEANQEAAASARRQAAENAPAAKPAASAQAAPGPAPVVATPASPPAPAAPSAFKTTEETLILVVDDSKVVRLKAGRLLAQQGYRVDYAVDGQDAVDKVAAELPDLVVTDVEMPHLDGFGLTRHLRGNARTAHVPIVMITSIDATHREAALREGVGLVLGKPFPEEPLLAHFRSHRFPLTAQATARSADRPDFAQTDAGALA